MPDQPISLIVDVDYDKHAAMDQILTYMIDNRPMDYGVSADINCPVPDTIAAAFDGCIWDWAVGVWMYGGHTVEPHKDMASKLDGNGHRIEGTMPSRHSALWFPLYGDYSKTPMTFHVPEHRDGKLERLVHAADIMIDRPMLVDMSVNYLHSMHNPNGHAIWYCLNFNPPESLSESHEKILSALL